MLYTIMVPGVTPATVAVQLDTHTALLDLCQWFAIGVVFYSFITDIVFAVLLSRVAGDSRSMVCSFVLCWACCVVS
jgi:hypothetical protein